MTDNNSMQHELEQLRAENENLKKNQGKSSHGELSLKVSQKGALSLYGLGRFPVTLYKTQWVRLLDFTDSIREFIAEHESEFKTKEL